MYVAYVISHQSNLRLFPHSLRLAFHTAYSGIFHLCCLLLLFPLLHFPPLQFYPYRIFHSRIFSRPDIPLSHARAMGGRLRICWWTKNKESTCYRTASY